MPTSNQKEIPISDHETIVKRILTVDPLGSMSPAGAPLHIRALTQLHGVFLHEKVIVRQVEPEWESNDFYINTKFLGVIANNGSTVSLGDLTEDKRPLYEQIEDYKAQNVPLISDLPSRQLLTPEDKELANTSSMELVLNRSKVQNYLHQEFLKKKLGGDK